MSFVDPAEFRLNDTDLDQPSLPPSISIPPDINAVTRNTEQEEKQQQQQQVDEEEDIDVAPRRAGFFHLVVKYYRIAFGEFNKCTVRRLFL